MRAREFISEDTQGNNNTITKNVALALPGAFKIPKLQNNDPYKQYRFGVAIAGAKGRAQRKKDGVPDYPSDNIFGENEIVVSYDPNVEEWIDDALQTLGMSPKDCVRIATQASQEMPDVAKISPVVAFKGYKRK